MSDQKDHWDEDELDYLNELYKRYPQPYPEYRRLWYVSKMAPNKMTVEFVEKFLKWNSEYIPRREAILRQWPKKIPIGMVLGLCQKAVKENGDQLMCEPRSFFNWLNKNRYLIKHKGYWHNDYSKD